MGRIDKKLRENGWVLTCNKPKHLVYKNYNIVAEFTLRSGCAWIFEYGAYLHPADEYPGCMGMWDETMLLFAKKMKQLRRAVFLEKAKKVFRILTLRRYEK